MPKFISALVAALATKGAAGLTVAALAAGATGAVVVGVSTGAITPGTFNESMKQQVEACKAATPSPGQHGIGACVSSAARQHGSNARENNPGQGDKKPKPDAKPSHPAHPETGKPDGTGKPDDTGKPATPGQSDHPGGPPTSRPSPHV